MALVVKNPPANAEVRDTSSILGWGRSSGGGHGNPLQYSCLENSMSRAAWWATVQRVTVRQDWNDLARTVLSLCFQDWSPCFSFSKIWMEVSVLRRPLWHCKYTAGQPLQERWGKPQEAPCKMCRGDKATHVLLSLGENNVSNTQLPLRNEQRK